MDYALVQVGKMTTMICGFLDLACLESAQIKLDKHFFNLVDLIKELQMEYAKLYSTSTLSLPSLENFNVLVTDLKSVR